MRGNTGELYGAEAKNEQLIVLIDGERVGAFDISKLPQGTDNDKNELRLKVKAGYRTVGFTFLANTHIPIDDLNQHYLRSVLDTNPLPGFIFYPQVSQVKILGPYNGTPSTDAPSRKKILTCTPATPQEETRCAQSILARLARQAFRRPISADDTRVLMEFYQSGRGKSGTFEDGIERGLQASCPIRSSFSARKRRRRGSARVRPIASTISSSPHACRSSSGARRPTIS